MVLSLAFDAAASTELFIFAPNCVTLTIQPFKKKKYVLRARTTFSFLSPGCACYLAGELRYTDYPTGHTQLNNHKESPVYRGHLLLGLCHRFVNLYS